MARLDIVSEDDDKGGKRRRRKESQARAVVIIFAAISFLFLVVMVKMNHSKRNKYVPSRIRRANAAAVAASHDGQHNSKVVKDSALLPLSSDSLYNQLLIPDLLGNYVSMDKYRGMVTLIVNVACLWGKTKVNYEELSILQEKYQSKGFSVLAFPISDFHQELPTNDKIQEFLTTEFPQVNFPVFGLSSLKENSVYQRLRQQSIPEPNVVRHNFYKYLVDHNGMAVKMYAKKENPLTLSADIEKLLSMIPSSSQQHQLVTH